MATNKAFATYQEIYDVNTVSNDVSIIGIHTPTGAKPRKMLKGFFEQFRKVKYLGCSIVGTVASRLPLDKLNIAIEEGQSGVDPRDVFNPILSHGCHGDSLSVALNNIYKATFSNEGSALGKEDIPKSNPVPLVGTWEDMYYRMLQDPSFKKHSMDRGFMLKKLRPMLYNVTANKQMTPVNVGSGPSNTGIGRLKAFSIPDGDEDSFDFVAFDEDTHTPSGSDPLTFSTNRLVNLGWMDTLGIVGGAGNQVVYSELPRIFMALLILPPAYRVSTAFRIIVTHRFAFKDFNTSLTLEGASEYYNWLSKLVPSGRAKDNDTLEVKDGDVTCRSDGVY